MINPKSLQHTQKPMVEMYCQGHKTENIEKTVEESAQKFFNGHTDRYLRWSSDTKTEDVDNDE